MALAAFNRVSRTTGLGQAGGADKGVPRAEWIREHVSAIPAGRTLATLCRRPGSPLMPLATKMFHFTSLVEYQESVCTMAGLERLGDSHVYVPIIDPMANTAVVVLSQPEHELHHNTTAPIPHPESMHMSSAIVVATNREEAFHFTLTGYCLFGQENPDMLPANYNEEIPACP